jgi:hypothetical protein
MAKTEIESIRRYDTILTSLVLFSMTLPTIFNQLDFPFKGIIIWIPIISFFLWMLFKIFGYTLITNYPEMFFIERARAWCYFLFLMVTFPINFLLFIVIPKTYISLIGAFFISILLKLIYKKIMRKLFYPEILPMNPKQDILLDKMFVESGSASIMYSISVLSFAMVVVFFFESSFNDSLINFILSLILFIYAVYREKRSKAYANDLAISLINSRWVKNFTNDNSHPRIK